MFVAGRCDGPRVLLGQGVPLLARELDQVEVARLGDLHGSDVRERKRKRGARDVEDERTREEGRGGAAAEESERGGGLRRASFTTSAGWSANTPTVQAPACRTTRCSASALPLAAAARSAAASSAQPAARVLCTASLIARPSARSTCRRTREGGGGRA